MVAQMSLWDTEEETVPAPQLYTKDDILVSPARWANGDASPADLEQLALTLLGDSTTRADTTGQKHVFYAISSGIVDGQVLYAWQYYCPLKYFYHIKFGLPIPDDAGVQPVQDDEDEEFL